MKALLIPYREKIFLQPQSRSWFRSRGLGSFATLYGLTGGVPVACSRTTSVERFEFSDGRQTRIIYLKKYWFLEPARIWKSLLRGTFLGSSKVKREYRFLDALGASGVAAAVPLGYGEQRKARFLLRSFLITEGIAEPIPLDQFIVRRLTSLSPLESRQVRGQLIKALARWTAHLHGQGFVHHDLYWRNIILAKGALSGLTVIDGPKGKRWWPWQERRCRAKDLATLDAPAALFFRRTERLRFLLIYLAEERLTGAARQLAADVLRAAQSERARQIGRVSDLQS